MVVTKDIKQSINSPYRVCHHENRRGIISLTGDKEEDRKKKHGKLLYNGQMQIHTENTKTSGSQSSCVTGDASFGRALVDSTLLLVPNYSSSSPEMPSFSPLWTFLCRRRLETTEKCRPHPSTSQANAIVVVVSSEFTPGLKSNLRFSPV